MPTYHPNKRLFQHAHLNNTAAIQKLVEKRRSLLEVQDGQGLTILFWATFFGNGPLMQWLIERGAHIHTTNDVGWTPLHWAAHQGHQQTITTLCRLGADVNALTPYGQTPLHLTAARGHYQPLQTLVNEGAFLTLKNAAGLTPAECAQAQGQCECAHFLIRRLKQMENAWQYFAEQPRQEVTLANQSLQLMTQKFKWAGTDNTTHCQKRQDALKNDHDPQIS